MHRFPSLGNPKKSIWLALWCHWAVTLTLPFFSSWLNPSVSKVHLFAAGFTFISQGLEKTRCQIWPLYTDTKLNLRGRALGEVEKNSFIALPGKGGHSRLSPQNYVPQPGRSSEEFYRNGSIFITWNKMKYPQRGCDRLMGILLMDFFHPVEVSVSAKQLKILRSVSLGWGGGRGGSTTYFDFDLV